MAYNPRRPMKTLEFFLSIDPVFNTADRKLGPNCLKIQLNPAVWNGGNSNWPKINDSGRACANPKERGLRLIRKKTSSNLPRFNCIVSQRLTIHSKVAI